MTSGVFARQRTQILRACVLGLLAFGVTSAPSNALQSSPQQTDSGSIQSSSFLIGFPPPGGGEVVPHVEWDKRLNIEERLQPLGDDMFGDRIDPHTGSLDFLHTDIVLPGNSNLEVALHRRARQGWQYGNSSAEFNDWEYVVPRITVVTADSVPWTGNRCTDDFNDQFPGVFLPDQTLVRGSEYSNGVNLEVGGSSEPLLESPRNAPWPANASHATNSNWYFTCQGNDVFIGHAPNGQTYRFDRHIVHDAMPGTSFNGGYLDRDTHILAATEVTDQHGNWVRYTYDTLGRLTRIHANDGREITLAYTGSSKVVSSASANGRTWTYNYRAGNGGGGMWLPPEYEYAGGVLSSVTLPDGRSWTFNIDAMLNPTPPTRFCLGWYNISMTHPSGAQGDFELMVLPHRTSYDQRTRVSQICPLYGATAVTNTLVDDTSVPVISVIEKSISGTGMPTSTWTYEYEQDTTSGTSLSDPTNWTRVTGPDAHVTFYHNWRMQPEGGAQSRVEVRASAAGPILEATDTTYIVEGRFGDAGPSGFTPIPLWSYPRRTALQTRNRGGDIYNTEHTYDTNEASSTYSWGNPTRVEQWSNLAGATTRTTDTTYEHNTSAWILGLPTRVVRNGLAFYDVTYNADGMPTAVDTLGVRSDTRSYNSDGTLTWTRDALNRQTSFANYHRGQPRAITLADNTSVAVTVDNNGWITGVTNARGHSTSYGYNPMGWLTSVTRPAPYTATSISYAYSAGGLVQTSTTGTARTQTTYDPRYRPTLVQQISLGADGTNIFNRIEYDAAGRVVFEALPSSSSTSTVGASTSYDALGRVTQVAETVTPFATTVTEYLSGNRTRVTDPLGNITTTTASGFGAPDDGQATLIQHPMGLNTAMTYNAWGQLLTARQYGSHNGYSSDHTQRWAYDSRLRLCRHSVPETGDTLYAHDDAHQLVGIARGQAAGTACAASMPAGATITQVFDNRGRIDQVLYPDASPDIDFSYDANGNMTGAQRGTSNWTYAYDTADALSQESLTIDGYSFATSYNRNGNGHLISQTTPAGRVVDYAPDGLGRATRARAGGFDYASNIAHQPFGALSAMTYGNGRSLSLSYDARQMLSELRVSGSPALVEFDYTRNASGQITNIADNAVAGQDRSFGYDGLGRLTSATGPWGAGAFSYDPLNNLRQQVLGSRTVDIQYDALNRVSSVRDTARDAFWDFYSYDNRGNVTDNDRLTWSYDLSEQPVTMSGQNSGSFVYDALRKRVRQDIDGERIYSVYSQAGALLYRLNHTTGEGTDYIRAGGSSVARIVSAGGSETVTYTHTNHLGSPVASTNASGTLLWREDYTPFGEARQQPAANDNDEGYTGHIADSDTGIIYMQARYYDPAIARFLSADPMEFSEGGPAYFNRYTYVANDPINTTDPTGMFLLPDHLTEAAQQRTRQTDQMLLQFQVTGEYTGSNDESWWFVGAGGAAGIGLRVTKLAWAQGAQGIRNSLIWGPIIQTGLGAGAGCWSGAQQGDCVTGAMAGAIWGGATGKLTTYVNLLTRGGMGAAGGTVAFFVGGAAGYIGTVGRQRSISSMQEALTIGAGKTVYLDIPGPFSSISVTNNGDGTFTITGGMSSTGSLIRREVTTRVCVKSEGC